MLLSYFVLKLHVAKAMYISEPPERMLRNCSWIAFWLWHSEKRLMEGIRNSIAKEAHFYYADM
jgi:hypothetical protein